LSDFLTFCSELDKQVRLKFFNLIERSEAEEQAVISKHLKLLEDGLGETSEEEDWKSPNPMWFEIRLPRNFSKNFLIKYALLSWYLPEITSFELREIIRKRATEKGFFELASYCHSKKLCSLAFFREIDLTKSELFGNIIQEGSIEISKFSDPDSGQLKTKRIRIPDFCFLVLRSPQRATPRVFRRGYNDHGSTTPDDRKGRNDYKLDWRSTQEQNIIELRRMEFSLQEQNRILELLRVSET